jgi:hypothetical protein
VHPQVCSTVPRLASNLRTKKQEAKQTRPLPFIIVIVMSSSNLVEW